MSSMRDRMVKEAADASAKSAKELKRCGDLALDVLIGVGGFSVEQANAIAGACLAMGPAVIAADKALDAKVKIILMDKFVDGMESKS